MRIGKEEPAIIIEPAQEPVPAPAPQPAPAPAPDKEPATTGVPG